MLLPRRLGDDEWEDPRAELVHRLLEYQQIRELVEWLARAAARRAEQFGRGVSPQRSEEHTSELQSQSNLVCRLLLEKKKKLMLTRDQGQMSGSQTSPLAGGIASNAPRQLVHMQEDSRLSQAAGVPLFI